MTRHRKPTEHAKAVAARSRRARTPETMRLVNRHIRRCRRRAHMTTNPNVERWLTAHADRCADELPLALLLAREWALEATGTGGSSDTPDPTANAAMNATRSMWGALLTLLAPWGPFADTSVLNTTRRIDQLLDSIDVFQRRVSDRDDKAALHATNLGMGECSICQRFAIGTLNDRLRPLPQTDERICQSCVQAWRRSALPKPDPSDWAAIRRQNFARKG